MNEQPGQPIQPQEPNIQPSVENQPPAPQPVTQPAPQPYAQPIVNAYQPSSQVGLPSAGVGGLAIASLILAFLAPFIGFILGLVSLKKAKREGRPKLVPTLAWIIGLLGTIAGLVVGIVVLFNLLNAGAVNKKFLNAVFEKDYDTACELWGSETPEDLADCRSTIDNVNEKYSGYTVVKISKTGKDTKLQANLESKTNETTGLGAAVIVTKGKNGSFVTNFIYGASSFANNEVEEKQEGSNTKASTLNPLYDSTPVTEDTFKTPCFRYDIPKPHGTVPTNPVCTGENNKFSSPDSSYQYSISTQGYGPYDDYNSLAKCYDYDKKLQMNSDEYYTFTLRSESDTTWGGQPAKKWSTVTYSSITESSWNNYFVTAYLPSPIDDTGFPASEPGTFIQYQCFTFSTYSKEGDTQAIFDKITSSWIWR